MKKTFIITLLSIFAVCISLFAIGNAKPVNADVLTLDGFGIEDGGSVRIASPIGMRFTANVSDNAKNEVLSIADGKDVTYGMVLIPESMLSGELTITTENSLNAVANKWQNSNSFTCVLGGKEVEGEIQDLGTGFYNTPVCARGYVKIGEDVYYTSNTVKRSMAFIIYSAIQAGEIEEFNGLKAEDFTPSISFEKTSVEIEMGESITATNNASLIIGGLDVSDKIVYESSNVNVATVDENGVVTAVSVGTATVTAKYSDDESVVNSYSVNVSFNKIPVKFGNDNVAYLGKTNGATLGVVSEGVYSLKVSNKDNVQLQGKDTTYYSANGIKTFSFMIKVSDSSDITTADANIVMWIQTTKGVSKAWSLQASNEVDLIYPYVKLYNEDGTALLTKADYSKWTKVVVNLSETYPRTNGLTDIWLDTREATVELKDLVLSTENAPFVAGEIPVMYNGNYTAKFIPTSASNISVNNGVYSVCDSDLRLKGINSKADVYVNEMGIKTFSFYIRVSDASAIDAASANIVLFVQDKSGNPVIASMQSAGDMVKFPGNVKMYTEDGKTALNCISDYSAWTLVKINVPNTYPRDIASIDISIDTRNATVEVKNATLSNEGLPLSQIFIPFGSDETAFLAASSSTTMSDIGDGVYTICNTVANDFIQIKGVNSTDSGYINSNGIKTFSFKFKGGENVVLWTQNIDASKNMIFSAHVESEVASAATNVKLYNESGERISAAKYSEWTTVVVSIADTYPRADLRTDFSIDTRGGTVYIKDLQFSTVAFPMD